MVLEITENNMADIGTLSADQLAQQQQITRQQRMAEMLLQSGLQQPQAQMVSGHYVAPSFTQNLANLANLYVGQKGIEKAEKAQIDLANRLRQLGVQESQDIISTMRGRQATPDVVPEGQTLLDDQGVMTMGSQKGADAIAPDLQSAYAKAIGARSPQGQALAPILAKQLMREPKYQEVSIVNDKTGNTETYRYDANASDPKSTMQLLGVSKPALSVADRIKFADEGINVNVGGVNAPVGGNQPVVGGQSAVNTQVAPTATAATPTATTNTPTTKEYDYFKAPPPPSGLSGKQAREFVSEQNKPLTGKANDTVNGAIGYQKSLNKLVDLFGKYSGTDMLKPNVKAEFKGALRTAQLQGKEAFGLGVLNGPDLEILEQILVDPTAFDAFLKDRSTINKLYNNQRDFTSDAIKTNYRSAQKAVPENLREYVEIKPIELKTETKPSKNKTVVKTGIVQDGPNKGKRVTQYSDGSMEYR
jgi:hypothetical protein